jgi:hypothetical protein
VRHRARAQREQQEEGDGRKPHDVLMITLALAAC